ncbi:copper resistance CopC family protein [Paenibacillus sp. NEAU-GSW1]|uniref:copper resistance CopC family protein n=1 Tax=Paenibacillus sp. NEAU-GSW1 TaxID=2682486 RepID=UPI0015667681|nr:copper resistance CopC family protein [Paenibacillus sp. NEAU-GSW1]
MKWTRIIVLIVAALWLIPGAAFAHSVLESSVPAKGEKVTVSPTEIAMAFNTEIESLSKFKLTNESGEEIDVSDSSAEGNEMSGKIAVPLANGSYTVKWTIIGADGHTVSGDYSFTVEAEEAAATESPAAESASPTVEASEAPSEQQTEPEAPAPSADAGNKTSQSAMSFTPILVVAVVIVVMAAVAGVLVYRRNKK